MATAIEFANRGAKLVLAARNLDKLQKLENELSNKGTEVLSVKTDVSQEEDCKQLMDETIKKFGKIDILINNAGISMRALFKDADLEVIKRLMDVNFWGTVFCTKYALPHLIETKGSVVGVISVAGHIGLPGRTGYSASKYAVRGFLDALRCETLKTGLHVLVIAPGFTASNIRNTSLTANGSAQGASPREEGKMMTAEKCAWHIAESTRKRKNQKVLTFMEGKVTVMLNKFFPKFMTKMAYNHMAKEPDSPFQ